MTYSLCFHPEAEKEFLNSFDYYEKQSIGLGERFEKSLEKQLLKIKETPLLFAKKRKQFRECPASIFPFIVVYKIYEEKKEILIVSIFHTSRNPIEKYKDV